METDEDRDDQTNNIDDREGEQNMFVDPMDEDPIETEILTQRSILQDEKVIKEKQADLKEDDDEYRKKRKRNSDEESKTVRKEEVEDSAEESEKERKVPEYSQTFPE